MKKNVSNEATCNDPLVRMPVNARRIIPIKIMVDNTSARGLTTVQIRTIFIDEVTKSELACSNACARNLE
jgi:hypothetical protein